MKVIVDIPNDLFRALKLKAAMEGCKVKDVVANCLRAYLQARKTPNSRRRIAFPIVRGKAGSLRISDEQIAEIEMLEEAANYSRSFK